MYQLQQGTNCSKRIKKFLEGEWNFTKKVCPHIRGGEVTAGYQFWLVLNLLLFNHIIQCIFYYHFLKAKFTSPVFLFIATIILVTRTIISSFFRSFKYYILGLQKD